MMADDGAPQVPSRKGRALVVLGVLPFVAILTCPVAGYLVVRNEFGEVNEEEANAEAATEQLARRYADAVVGTGDSNPSDDRLDQLVSGDQVAVLAVDREASHADLVLVLATREAFSGLFAGHLEVRACYEVAFTGLGTDHGTYTFLRLDTCPP
ncbi:MAG: hypothetical protein ACRDT2_01730 [Natronosporangium sp.]